MSRNRVVAEVGMSWEIPRVGRKGGDVRRKMAEMGCSRLGLEKEAPAEATLEIDNPTGQ